MRSCCQLTTLRLEKGCSGERMKPGLLLAVTLFAACLCLQTPCSFTEAARLQKGDERVDRTQSDDSQPLQTHNSFKQASARSQLIPRLLHQTYKSGNVTAREEGLMRSWRLTNPGWETRFYDDGACLTLVENLFPEYLQAYKALSKNVERADFFRYLAVLQHGGAYADVDTESVAPLDSIIQPEDAMLVAWEDEHSTIQGTVTARFARQRQILQWMFLATPGHPALREICDRIADNAVRQYEASPHLATLLRTGPGVFTDVMLKYAYMYPAKQANEAGRVRILPKISFGGMSRWQTGLLPSEEPGRAVIHYDLASWKVPGIMLKERSTEQSSVESVESKVISQLELSEVGSSSVIDPAFKNLAYLGLPEQLTHEDQLFPVSTLQNPPFTMMVHLVGHGDEQAGFDTASQITGWGEWRLPGILPLQPSVVDALIGPYGDAAGSEKTPRAFLDIGAGIGFFSLAAASRGGHALAFELGAKTVASFNASIEYNGFADRITLQQVALGATEEEICNDMLTSRKPSQLSIDMERGYGHPRLHAMTPTCKSRVTRQPAAAAVPDSMDVGAVRISASGWEAWILDSLKPMIQRCRPEAILVELYTESLESTGYPGRASDMIATLKDQGYSNLTHIGHICIRSRILSAQSNGITLSAQEALKSPGWCTFSPDQFWLAYEEESPLLGEPELLLFKRSTL